MNTIKTIDLWTEQHINHYECFNGAFVDGCEEGAIPFDEYKIIKNCNCIIECNDKKINISNKHHAICFYKEKIPIRLVVINKDTEVNRCIEIALNQFFKDRTLKDLYNEKKIQSSIIDLKETPIFNTADFTKEIDVGSCDRWNLLYNMLKGSYTESETKYGNYESDKYEFNPNLYIKYQLITDTERFFIEHHCAFINEIKTRIIPIQEHSSLTGNIEPKE